MREAGFRVATVDRDASAPGHAFAHARVLASVADSAAVREAAAREHADVILSGIEVGVLPAAIASVALGLPTIGVDVATRCLDKGLMRQAWSTKRLPQPDFRLVDNAKVLPIVIEEFGLPLVLKPRRSNGSKGVSVILNAEDIADATEDAVAYAGDFGFIVERYVDGPLLTADGFADGERVEIAAIGDVETQAVSRFRVNMSLNYPANYSSTVVGEAKRVVSEAVRALGLKNSPFHCECIVSAGGVVLVEIGPRSGGSYIGSVIVPAVSGLASAVVSAEMLLGERPDITPRALGGASLTFLSAPPGRLKEVTGVRQARELPGVIEVDTTLAVGEQGGAVACDNARHGYVVTVGATRNEAAGRAGAARDTVHFDMQPADLAAGAAWERR